MISNGMKASAPTWNDNFLSRTAEETSTVAKVTLENTLDPNSGDTVENAQRAINETFDAVGMSGEGDTTRKNYSSQNVVTNGESHKQAIGKLDAEFDVATGHNHDGANSSPVSSMNLSNFNKYFAEYQAAEFDGAVGTTATVTSAFSGKAPGGSVSTMGVVTAGAESRVEIRTKGTGLYVEDAGGQRVYGKISEATGAWTLSFFTNEAGVETAHSLSAQNIVILYREVFSAATRPTFPADLGAFDSLDLTADIVSASETLEGKVFLANTAATEVGTSSAKGTSVRASKEDHAHKGVHSVKKQGDTSLYGDVEFVPGTDIQITQSGQQITISQSGLASHLADTTDAHQASAIANTPSGNLAATDLQSAVNELQTDIDTRATGSSLTAHEADTTNIHGIADTSLLLTTTGAQVVTNKDLDGGTASNTNRVTIPKNTKVNLNALTRKQGTILYASDENKFYQDTGAALTELGGGSGGGLYTISGTRDVPSNVNVSDGVTFSGTNARNLKFIQSANAQTVITANPQIAAGNVIGQELLLIGRHDFQVLTFANGNGLSLNGPITLYAENNITLVWDGTNWLEISRSH